MRCLHIRSRRISTILVICLLFSTFVLLSVERKKFNNITVQLNYTLKGLTLLLDEPPSMKVNKLPARLFDAEELDLKFLDANFSSQFEVVDSINLNVPANKKTSFVLVVPRRINKNFLSAFNHSNERAALIAASMLNTLHHLDGLACLPRSSKRYLQERANFSRKEDWKSLFNSTACNFMKRTWSIQIRNSGKIKAFYFRFSNGHTLTNDFIPYGSVNMFQMCNIINGPFVLRKEVFTRLGGLKPQLGRTTLLDFFVRSGGKLKIGKSADCFFGDELFKADRGSLSGLGDYPEYSNFGSAHNVLRIIMEDRIEWTKCVATDSLCKEEPYLGPPSTLPKIGQPICCAVMLSQMLVDIVKVLNKLGIQYRLMYGTLLGGERSNAFIPYTRDFDLTLEYKYSKNKDSYVTLQKYFGDDYYISGHSFIDFPRLLPLYPTHMDLKTGSFFKDEYDLKGDLFFSQAINKSIEGLLPFTSTEWNSRSYTDFYKVEDDVWKGSSVTNINGVNYTTVKEKHKYLEEWYGKSWRKPVLKTFKEQSDKGAVCC